MGLRAELEFRPLGRQDFADLQKWLSAPHVREWWGEPLDLGDIENEFGPCVDGVDPTLVFVVTFAARPIGIVQSYMLSATPDYETAVGVSDAAGMDLFIGEADMLGRGLGTAIVRDYLTVIGWKAFPEAKRYMAGPSISNLRSRRTFESAGFVHAHDADVPGEPEREAVMVVERQSPS